MSSTDPLLAAMNATDHRDISGVQIDVRKAAAARVKRVIYPAGFRWSTHMKPIVGTDACMHGHVGFLARGRIRIEYPDGCVRDFAAPDVVEIELGMTAG